MNLVRVGFVRTRSLRGAVSRMQWPFFLGATLFAMAVSGQCIEGVPAAYPLGGQVALHILDPDCSFDPKWRKYLADPSVEGVALVYHEHTAGTQPMQLATTNPSSGQSLTVWSLDGKISTNATTTTASDVGGDFSAFVANVEGTSCYSIRVGSAVTLPYSASVAGLVRKVIAGPQCILHVIKPNAMRQLLSVQLPDGASLVKLDLASNLSARRIVVDTEQFPASPELPSAVGVRQRAYKASVPLILVLKKEKMQGWPHIDCKIAPDGAIRVRVKVDSGTCILALADSIVKAWGVNQPQLTSTIHAGVPLYEANAQEWTSVAIPPGARQQVLLFLESGFRRFSYTVAVQNAARSVCVGSKTAIKKLDGQGFQAMVKNIVDYLSASPCMEVSSVQAVK